MFAFTLSKTLAATALAVGALGTASVAQASPPGPNAVAPTGIAAPGKHPEIIAVKHPDFIFLEGHKDPNFIFLEGHKRPNFIFLEGQKHPDASKHPDILGVLGARGSARTGDALRFLIVIRKAG